MFMNDVNKKDEIRRIAIEDLRRFGVKCRPKKQKTSGEATKTTRRLFKTDLHLLPKQTVTLPTGQQLVVPKLVHELCSFILSGVKTEGLFRKGGSKARQNELRLLLDAGCSLQDSHHVIDVANVLKTFFRELPEPLFPLAYHESFLRCTLLSENCSNGLLLTCLLLPSEHLNVLTYFAQFLNDVTKYSTINKMDSYNLAVIIGPNVFPIQEKIHNTSLRLTKICQLFKILIENASSIGLISDTIIDRIAPLSTSGNSLSDEDINIKNRRRKKRRSGSLTRMFSGLRKIVGSKHTENVLPSLTDTPDLLKTPRLTKSTRKRKLEPNGFSNKKKLEMLQNLPQGTALSTPISINPNPKRSSPHKSTSRNDGALTKEKKSQWSLGNRRAKYTKRVGDERDINTFSGTKAALERRWSAVSQTTVFKRTKTRNSLASTEIHSVVSTEPNTVSNLVENENSDYIKIPISEYEEIKNRVSALEHTISVELDQFNGKTVEIDSLLSTENTESLIQVQNAYEKTVTEAEHLSPTTDILARRLSKELKIRRSAEQKIVRSPSARKIGTLRRRSREAEKQNARVQRNQSWHIQSTGNVQRTHLKRGKPNTILTGLRNRTPLKANPNVVHVNTTSESPIIKSWRSNSLPGINKTPPILNQQQSMNAIQNSNKWTSAEGFFCKLKTPVDSNKTVRSSIARLRSQNAGMVLAKARLFDGLVDSDTSSNSSNLLPNIKTGNKIGAIRNSNGMKSFKCDEKQCSRHSISPKRKYEESPTLTSSFPLIFAEKENHLHFEGIHKYFSDSTEKAALKDCNPNCVGDYSTPNGMPNIKRSLTVKSPKRICCTPIYNQDHKQTPLKVLPIKRII